MNGLSGDAGRLLRALRLAGANAPGRARTDAELAELTGMPARDVIDAARELLAAGYLVLAGPQGRWLGTLAEARQYRAGLARRVAHVAGRITALDRAIAAHSAQGMLFPAE